MYRSSLYIVIAILSISSMSCVQEVPPAEKQEYLRSSIEDKIQAMVDRRETECEELILQQAEAWVDSTYRAAPRKYLVDSISIPPKPVRPQGE